MNRLMMRVALGLLALVAPVAIIFNADLYRFLIADCYSNYTGEFYIEADSYCMDVDDTTNLRAYESEGEVSWDILYQPGGWELAAEVGCQNTLQPASGSGLPGTVLIAGTDTYQNITDWAIIEIGDECCECCCPSITWSNVYEGDWAPPEGNEGAPSIQEDPDIGLYAVYYEVLAEIRISNSNCKQGWHDFLHVISGSSKTKFTTCNTSLPDCDTTLIPCPSSNNCESSEFDHTPDCKSKFAPGHNYKTMVACGEQDVAVDGFQDFPGVEIQPRPDLLCCAQWDYDFVTSSVWNCYDDEFPEWQLLAYFTWETSGCYALAPDVNPSCVPYGSSHCSPDEIPLVYAGKIYSKCGPIDNSFGPLTILDDCRALYCGAKEPPSYADCCATGEDCAEEQDPQRGSQHCPDCE